MNDTGRRGMFLKGRRKCWNIVWFIYADLFRPQIQATFLIGKVHGIISQVHQQEISQHRCPKQHGEDVVPLFSSLTLTLCLNVSNSPLWLPISPPIYDSQIGDSLVLVSYMALSIIHISTPPLRFKQLEAQYCLLILHPNCLAQELGCRNILHFFEWMTK